MDLKEKLDQQISRAVRDVVIKLSRDEVPDPGTLALAIASGQTTDSLVGESQKKIDRRNDAAKSKEHPNAPPAVSQANQQSGQFVHPLTPQNVRQAAQQEAQGSPEIAAPNQPAPAVHQPPAGQPNVSQPGPVQPGPGPAKSQT